MGLASVQATSVREESGDRALQAVADALRESARRPGDSAYRIGGEEFAMLLVDTDAAGAGRVMDLVRQSLRRRAPPHELSPTGRLTVSQGASQIVGGDTAAAVEHADAALYRAKREGRDRAYFDALAVAA